MGFSKLRLPRFGGLLFLFPSSAVREGQNGTGIGVGCLLTNCRRRCQCLSARSRLTVCVTAYDLPSSSLAVRSYSVLCCGPTLCSMLAPARPPRLSLPHGPRCLALSSLTSEAATPHERPQAEASAGWVALAAVRAKAAYRERHPGAVPGAALLWSV